MVLARFAHEGPIVRLAFTPDGSRLVTTAEDRTVKVWDDRRLHRDPSSGSGQPDVATALAVVRRRPVVPRRPDGRVARRPIPIPGRPATGRRATPAGPTARGRRPVDDAGAPSRVAEREPNDAAGAGDRRGRPGGDHRDHRRRRSAARADADLYRFSAKAGEPWVIEVDAARSGSKLDSFVEVLDAAGRRIERVRLQAVRDSYFTFRGKDDSDRRRLPPLQLGRDAT